MNDVIALLRRSRVQQGISQTELGEAVGLSLRQISRWETGQKGGNLKGEELLKIIAFLKVPFQEILKHLDKQAARNLAEEVFLSEEEEELLRRLTPNQRSAVLEMVRQILDEKP